MPSFVFPQQLWDILEDKFTLLPDYSGRAMLNRTCIALVGDERDLLRFIAELIRLSDDTDTVDTTTVQILADTVRTDSMGYDTVFYFPGITLEYEADDDQTPHQPPAG